MSVKVEFKLPGDGPNYTIYSIQVPVEAISTKSEHEDTDLVQEQVAKFSALAINEVRNMTKSHVNERSQETQTPRSSHSDCAIAACTQTLLHVDLAIRIKLVDMNGGMENTYYIAKHAPLRAALKVYAEQLDLPTCLFSMRHERVRIRAMDTADSLHITDGTKLEVRRRNPELELLDSTPTKKTSSDGRMEDPFMEDVATSTEVGTEGPPEWRAEWRKG